MIHHNGELTAKTIKLIELITRDLICNVKYKLPHKNCNQMINMVIFSEWLHARFELLMKHNNAE